LHLFFRADTDRFITYSRIIVAYQYNSL